MIVARSYCASSFDGVARGGDGKTAEGGFILPQIEGRRAGTTPRWADIREMAEFSEQMGFDSLWVVDHLLYGFGTEEPVRGVWEGWSLLSALAAVTTRPDLGTLVVCTGFQVRRCWPRWLTRSTRSATAG